MKTQCDNGCLSHELDIMQFLQDLPTILDVSAVSLVLHSDGIIPK